MLDCKVRGLLREQRDRQRNIGKEIGFFFKKVLGIFVMMLTSMMPLGMLVFVPIADIIQIKMLLIVWVYFYVFKVFLLGHKVLLKVGKLSLNEKHKF